MLLLLESRALVEPEVHQFAVGEVLSSYWRDFDGHEKDFMPAFLTNDILRMWRTFCVNYEARTETDPPEKKAKRKLKNYKLKHSRLLTCFSGILYLLARFGAEGTVSPRAAREMVELTPTARLRWLSESVSGTSDLVDEALCLYCDFLRETEAEEDELIQRFLNEDESSKLFESASAFGDKVFDLLESVGTGSGGSKTKLYRLLVV